MDEATLTELLKNAQVSTGDTSSLFDINALIQTFAPFMLALTVVSILITVLYIISVISKWRTHKAIMDMRKLLIEMNERDKLRAPQAPVQPPTPPTTTTS